MSTSAETLAGEAERVLLAMRGTVEAGRDAAAMLAAYGNGRRRWTALLLMDGPSEDPTGWARLTDWLRRSNADGAVLGMDSFMRDLSTAEAPAYASSGLRPKTDPAAYEAVLLSAWRRRSAGEVETCAALSLGYGRADDGTVEWRDPVAGLPLVGPVADAVASGLLSSGDNRSEVVMREMAAAGHVVIDARGRRHYRRQSGS